MNKFLESVMLRKEAASSDDIHEFTGSPLTYFSSELRDAAIKHSRDYYKSRERRGLDPLLFPESRPVAHELITAPINTVFGGFPGALVGGVAGDIISRKLKARRKHRDAAVLSGVALGGVGGYLLARKGINDYTDRVKAKNSELYYRNDPYLYLKNFADSDPEAAEYVEKLHRLQDKLQHEPEDVMAKKYLKLLAEARLQRAK